MKEVKIGCSSSYQKYGKRLDTAIIQLPSNSNISGLFTSNKFPAAPVKVAKRNLTCLDKKKKTALFINAGNANAATGSEGLKDINKMFANYKDVNVLPFSTGVIGEDLIYRGMENPFLMLIKILVEVVGKILLVQL